MRSCEFADRNREGAKILSLPLLGHEILDLGVSVGGSPFSPLQVEISPIQSINESINMGDQ